MHTAVASVGEARRGVRGRLGCDENITQEMVDAAYAEAKAYDEWIVSIQQEAQATYIADYRGIAGESVPDVFEDIALLVEGRARRVGEGSKLIALQADADQFEAIRDIPGLRRISVNMDVAPMLDWARRNSKAKDVHCTTTSIPYTGDGVRVAVVDSGVQYGYEYEEETYSHPRLKQPIATKNFVCTDGRGTGDFCGPLGHGTLVAGVIFCQSEEQEEGGACEPEEGIRVGIAYDADMVVAKVVDNRPHESCGPGACNPPCVSCESQYSVQENWTVSLEAFQWSVVDPAPAPEANLISSSVGVYGGQHTHEYTVADSTSSLNVDWVVSSSGSSFIQACGNSGTSGVLPPSGAYNCVAVANYDDQNDDDRSQNEMAATSSWGPTADERRKPDICAPGTFIDTTKLCWSDGCSIFREATGTSFAAPHVAGVFALLLEARPSLTPPQIHAILVNSADFMETENQDDWAEQPGWGMVNALSAVVQRNYIEQGTLDDDDDADTVYLDSVPADEEVVITCVWHRAMTDEDSPVKDGGSNPAPANLDLILEAKTSAQLTWAVVDRTQEGVDYDGSDGKSEDNVRQVRGEQNSLGTLLFRVRVEHNPTDDTPYAGSQAYSLASRHAFD